MWPYSSVEALFGGNKLVFALLVEIIIDHQLHELDREAIGRIADMLVQGMNAVDRSTGENNAEALS